MRVARYLGLARIPGVIVMEADTLAAVAEVQAGGYRGALAPDAGGVWVTTHREARLTHLDAGTCAPTRDLALPGRPVAVTVAGGDPVVLLGDGVLVRVGAGTGAVEARGEVAAETTAIAAADGLLWAVSGAWTGRGFAVRLACLDPVGLAAVAAFDLGEATYFGALAVADGLVRVSMAGPDPDRAEVVLEARSGRVLGPGEAPPGPRGIAEEGGSRWVRQGTEVRRVDIVSGAVMATGRLAAPDAGAAAVAHGRLWTCTHQIPRRTRGET